jgi:5-methylcytosine-specific restriction endonuclease McrA
MAKVVRSQAAKRQFLKSKGLTRIPKGYQIDHIKPLSQGGKDEPSNMQLLSTKDHQRKTASERRRH